MKCFFVPVSYNMVWKNLYDTQINKDKKGRLNAHSSFWKEKGHRNQLVIVQWYLEIIDGWHPWRLSMLCRYKRYKRLSIKHLSDLLGGENSLVATAKSKGLGETKQGTGEGSKGSTWICFQIFFSWKSWS